ncbi:MAG: formate dehydrogenase subunit alpha [Deltaproteobacteria bacterium]|nr:formate dehydrogenase subunit alpha [Deltaproteobacteria bacterium]
MENISCTIDGKTITAGRDRTVLELAQENGIEIPTLCHTDVLAPTGACRICLVEVEGARALMPSCATRIGDLPGERIVHTNSEKVRQARRIVLELLWSAHPNDCTVCEKSGACDLQKYSYEYNVDIERYRSRDPYDFPPDYNNPYYVRDYNKCILCGRCIRACAELQGNYVFDFARRGFSTMVSTPMGAELRDSNCVFCGNCVALCPTGALVERSRLGKGREWEFKKTHTTCPYCGCGCTFDLCTRNNEIVKVDSSDAKKNIVNRTTLCVKGRFGLGFVNSADRLNHPLVRRVPKKEGTGTLKDYERVSWKEALDLVEQRLLKIRSEHGPDAIGGFSSARTTNEENYLFQKFMRAAVGTNNVDHCARLCHASTVAGLAKAFGSGAMTNSIDEIIDSDCILVTGSNTTETHPIVSLEIKKAVLRGARLMVIEPRNIELCDIAEMSLHQRPGTDVAWLNGMMHVIIAEGLENREFIHERCENFEAVREGVREYTPEKVERITGIPADDLRRAARIYAKAERATILYAMGITQHTSGTDNVLSIANLAMLCGQIGRRSTGVNPLRGQNNVQGACDMGALPNVYPGYQKVDDFSVQQKFEKAWGVKLNNRIGMTVTRMMEAAQEGTLKALYIMGENPMLTDPDINHVEKALKNLDFLVVQDIFPTETALLADVILPGVSFAEKTGTFTNTERRVQMVRKAIDPLEERRQDFQIICELSRRLGYKMSYRDQAAVMKEIAKLTPSYGGISHNRLETGPGLQWPCIDSRHPGTLFLHAGGFVRGKGLFTPCQHRDPAELPDEEFPITLTTGRVLEHYHSGSMSRRAAPLNEHVPTAWVEISPDLAQKLGVEHGDSVAVTSRRGRIETVARVTGKVNGDVVFIPFHFAEAAANRLTNSALDPVAQIPEYKVCAVRIDKI